MTDVKWVSMDGNAAAAHSAHAMSEVVAIYPITPSSPMAEISDEYSAKERKNIFGNVPIVYEMQSEGGAVAAIHGAMAAGSLTTTFTASQGLLLMIPSMYKIAGEMMPTVFNVSARTLSTHALSIFGDHSDVMACRQTGFALLASANQQEVMDQAAIAMATSIKSTVPFLHFFEGFRTSHEIAKFKELPYDVMLDIIDKEALAKFRARGLNPDRPILRGTAMNPEIWFQNAETRNLQYDAVVGHLKDVYKKFGELTGRYYKPYEYYGHPEADTLLVAMGTGTEIIQETIDYLNAKTGSKIGVLAVRLYRPWSIADVLSEVPVTVKRIAVLDRTKECGALGEPLYLDIVSTFEEGRRKGLTDITPKIIGGRYGLSSKDFTPNHVKAIIEHLDGVSPEKWINGFTVGIEDDVSHRSLKAKEDIYTEDSSVYALKFWGLGSDGTVGANKNSIKIIGDHTDMYVQGHFVYDSKKAGGTTVSHLRFSKKPIKSHYLINNPKFVAIHNKEFLGMYEVLAGLQEGGMVLLNTDLPADKVFASFPEREQKIMIAKKARLFAIDANKITNELGIPGRINTTMQAAFFKITGIMSVEKVTEAVTKAIHKSYGKKGEKVVNLNIKAFTTGLDSFVEIPVPSSVGQAAPMAPALVVKPEDKGFSDILKNVIEPIIHFSGDSIPVSALPIDGAFPTGTTRYEKRSIATHVPKWNPELCIQCARCAFACPHAAVRLKVSKISDIQLSAEEYPTIQMKGKGAGEADRFRVQVFPDDCTGCGVCVDACLGKDKQSSAKAIEMVYKYDVLADLRKSEKEFLRLPATDEMFAEKSSLKGAMLNDPLFEFSGACPGCGETPYVKLVTQLVGERMIQANATGCSSIYGGTAPTIPFCKNAEGRGPAWQSSLFEDNAEFGLGIRLGIDFNSEMATRLREEMLADPKTAPALKEALAAIHPLCAQQAEEDKFKASKAAYFKIRDMVKNAPAGSNEAKLAELAPYLLDTSIWIVGGDGWAYDIGYGGLDHVLASGKNVNILVLDTEVYSNTGGQRSKATFMGGIAKFAAAGKETHKKDLGQMAMQYRNVYVASVNFSADFNQTLKAFREAVTYPGVSLIIAYSNCIEHGISMNHGPEFGKLAADCGYWINYRYDPRLLLEKKNPLQIDTKEPKAGLREFLKGERRYARLIDERPERAEELFCEAERFVKNRYEWYKQLAAMSYENYVIPGDGVCSTTGECGKKD